MVTGILLFVIVCELAAIYEKIGEMKNGQRDIND